MSHLKKPEFRLGMRTIKTAISVMICIIIMEIFSRGNPMIACLSAVFSTRQDVQSSYKFGSSRIIGNSLGALGALFYAFVIHTFGANFWIDILLVPLLIIFVIVSNDAINNNAGIIGGNAAMLIIVFSIPTTASIAYAFERVLDTFIGVIVAIVVNSLLNKPKFLRVHEEESELSELKKEAETLEKDIVKKFKTPKD